MEFVQKFMFRIHFTCTVFSYFASNAAAIKKFELDIEFDFDFLLFGIVSSEKPYRLAWQFNRLNPYQFERKDDYPIGLNGKTSEFPLYAFTHEENHTSYFLLANRDEGTLLIPELRNFDYLMLVKGALGFFDEHKLKQDVKAIPTVQLIYPVNLDEVKSKQNLMYIE